MSGYPGAGATAGWLALSAVLAGVVALEVSEDVDLAPMVTAAPIEATATEADELDLTIVAAPSPDALDDIVERPLFSTLRRPFEPVIEEQPMVAAVPNQRLSLQLVGTMLSESSEVVLLKHPIKGLLRLREGQVVEGWKVGDIGHNLVELRRGDEVEWLRLRTDLLLPERQDHKTPNPPKKNNKGQEKAAATKPEATGERAPPAE